MDKVKTAFQNFGRVIVDPILYLSVTGIILAIATVCSLGSGVVATARCSPRQPTPR